MRAPPPWAPKFFQFHAVFRKICNIVCWRPPGELAPPGEILDPPLTTIIKLFTDQSELSALPHRVIAIVCSGLREVRLGLTDRRKEKYWEWTDGSPWDYNVFPNQILQVTLAFRFLTVLEKNIIS